METALESCTTPFMIKVKYQMDCQPPRATVNTGDLLRLLQRFDWGKAAYNVNNMVKGRLAFSVEGITKVSQYMRVEHAVEILTIIKLQGKPCLPDIMLQFAYLTKEAAIEKMERAEEADDELGPSSPKRPRISFGPPTAAHSARMDEEEIKAIADQVQICVLSLLRLVKRALYRR